jgi:hypothetical protein
MEISGTSAIVGAFTTLFNEKEVMMACSDEIYFVILHAINENGNVNYKLNFKVLYYEQIKGIYRFGFRLGTVRPMPEEWY